MSIQLDRQHIILYICLAVTVLAGTYFIADKRAESARTEAAVAKAELAQTLDANKQFQAQVAAQLAQLQQQNQALQVQLAKRDKVEKSVSTQNGSLTPPQVASGIQTATGAKEGEATANGQFIQLDLPLGQQALSALQLVPMLQADKADLTLEVSNAEKQIDLEKQSHSSDLKADEAKLNSCQADLKSAKHSKLKDVMKTAGIALGVGIGIGLHFR
jgi:hypothetical protein